MSLSTPGTYYWQASYSGDANSNNAASKSTCGSEVETVTAVAASTNLTTSLSGGGSTSPSISVPAGTAVTDTATLSGTNAASAGGTVTYSVYSDNKCSDFVAGGGTVTVSAGSVPASSAVSLSTPGTYYWQASYSGDTSSNNAASTSTCGSEVETVTAVAASTNLTTSLSGGGSTSPSISVPAGTAVTDTATLSGTNAASAGGTVTYSVYSDNKCSDFVAGGGTVTVSAGSVPASSAVSLSTPGTYYWQASYSGDTNSNNAASKSTCGSEVETVTAVAASTNLTTSLSGGGSTSPSISVPAGTAVTDTATLSGTNAASAGGTVTYSVYSDNKCSDFVAGGGTVTVSAGSVPASSAVSLSTPGTYYWQASYSGDTSSNNAASKSTCGSEVETVTAVAASTNLTTSLSGGGSTGPSISVPAGTAVTDTATLSGTNAASAGGTVTYSVYSDNKCSDFVAGGGTVTVSAGSVPASSAVSLSTPGTYYWQASYSGDTSSNNAASTSTCGSEVETVTAVVASTSLSTSLSGGGSTSPSISVPAGTAVTDTATLSGTNAASAGGTVTYSLYSDNKCSHLVINAGTVKVTDGKVPASNPVSLTKPGTYYWEASYSGDATNAPSKSVPGSEVETVSAVVKSTGLTTSLSDGGRWGPSISVPAGTAVTDTATLSGTNAASAGGTVTYQLYSDNKCSHLVINAGTVKVTDGKVPASNPVSLTKPGTYYWEASYSGDATNAPSKSVPGSEVETVSAVVKSTGLTTSLSDGGRWGPSISVPAGTAVTDTATLSGTNAASAGGTVTYSLYSDNKCSHLVINAGTVKVTDGKVPASNPVSLTKPGTYYWEASYSGDATNAPSKSVPGSEVETVNSAGRGTW